MGSDPPAPAPTESTADIMRAFIQYLPELTRVINQQVIPTEQAKLEAVQKLSPEFAKAGVDADKIIKLGQALSDLAVLEGPGSKLADVSAEISRRVDPEFYKSRAISSQALDSLINSFGDVSKLSPAELEAAARGAAEYQQARGNAFSGAPISAIENALLFKDELDKKRALVSDALRTSAAFMPATRSGFDVVAAALGRPSTFLGTSAFSGGSEAYGLGKSMFGGLTDLQTTRMQLDATRRDALDRFNETLSALPNVSV